MKYCLRLWVWGCPVFRSLRGVIFAVVTWLPLNSVASQFPVTQAASEEARIFNAENADLFGEDPYFYTELKLKKIDTSGNDDYATINVDGVDQQAHPGDLLMSPCLSLSRILKDAVLLDHCGSYAFLWLRESVASVAAIKLRVLTARVGGVVEQEPHIIDLRGNVDVQRLVSDYRHRLYDRPLSLLGAINVEVVSGDTGREYHITPGRDKSIFPTLFLEPSDRIRALNGVDLSGAQSLTEVYERLDDIGYMAITIERNRENWVVMVDFEPMKAGFK
jgi:general secretion pathway protein C